MTHRSTRTAARHAGRMAAPFAALSLALLLGACTDGERAPQAQEAQQADGQQATSPADAQAAAAGTAVSSAAGLVGMRMPPYPNGLTEVSGSCISGGEGLEHACDYGIAVLGRSNGDATTAELVYLVGSRNGDSKAGNPVWDITDAMDVPTADGYLLQFGDCRADDQPAPGVVALTRHDGNSEFSADIAWARRYDTASGRFEPIDAATVRCIDPGYGV